MTESHDWFRNRLEALLDPRHELVRLAGILNWPRFDETFGELHSDRGCRGQPTRLMVGLEYRKQRYRRSDESVVARGVENPYWQSCCGEDYFPYHPLIDPSSRTRSRQRIRASGAEWVGKATIDAGLTSGTVTPREWRRVTVDTTVPDQAVTLPTDRNLRNHSRVRLVRRCRPHGVGWRSSDARQGPPARRRANRDAHARPFRRRNRQLRCLRTYLGRVVQDLERKTAGRQDLEVVGTRTGDGPAVTGAG